MASLAPWLAVLGSLAAASAQARTLEVGPGKEYKQPSAAIAAAKDGDRVAISPGEYFDCATTRAANLTIEGVGDASKVVLTDKACGGKGLLVIGGDKTTVRNLTLTRARVPDGNGAGIRNEAPNLTVDGVLFINNQNGILSTPPSPGTVLIRNSRFERNGGCGNPGGCAHGMYVEGSSLVRVENSHFVGTKEGHHLKSRAQRTEVVGSTLEDGPDGTASYLVDVSNGGSVLLRGNTMEKGPNAQNTSAAVVIGAEGVTQPTREITVVDNSFRNDLSKPTVFVNNLTATEAQLRDNHFTGQVRPLSGDGSVSPK